MANINDLVNSAQGIDAGTSPKVLELLAAADKIKPNSAMPRRNLVGEFNSSLQDFRDLSTKDKAMSLAQGFFGVPGGASALPALGATSQVVEAAGAGPAQALVEGRPNQVPQEFANAMSGKSTAQYGDVLRSAGAPEWAASSAGVLAAAATDPVAVLGGAAVRAGGALKDAVHGSNALKKAVIGVHSVVSHVNPRAAAYAVDEGFSMIKPSLMKDDAEAAQHTANRIYQVTDNHIKPEVNKAWDKAASDTRSLSVHKDLNQSLALRVSDELNSDIAQELSDEIRNIPIAKVAGTLSETPRVTAVRKTVQTFKKANTLEEETQGLKMSGPTKSRAKTEVTRSLNDEPGQLYKVIDETRTTTGGRTKAPTDTLTLGGLLDEINSGKVTDVSAGSWVSVLRRLQNMRNNPLAMQTANQIADHLKSVSPAYAEAAQKSRMWGDILEARRELVGDKTRFGVASEGYNLTNYFSANNPPNGAMATAAKRLDQAIEHFNYNAMGQKVRNLPLFEKRIKDISAAHNYNKVLPSITPLSMAGVGAGAARHANVPNVAIGAGMAGVLLSGSRRFNAMVGKALYGKGTTPLQKAWANLPEGVRNSAAADFAVDALRGARNELIGKQITGKD